MEEEDEGEEVLRAPAKIVPLQCEQYTKRCRLGLHLNNRKEKLFYATVYDFRWFTIYALSLRKVCIYGMRIEVQTWPSGKRV